MFWFSVKRFFALGFAAIIALAACLILRGGNVCKFSALQGERTFYLRSASSQGLQTQTLEISELFDVQGESVRFLLSADELDGDTDAFALEIGGMYGADFLFFEDAGGVRSYYFYTPKFSDGLCVAGRQVNLHIAIEGDRCVVGSPIIFGGF